MKRLPNVYACILCQSSSTQNFYLKNNRSHIDTAYFKCDICHLVFLDPEKRLSSEEEKARYCKHQNSIDDAGYVAFLELIIQPLSKVLKLKAKGIDFGCGPNPVLSTLLTQKEYQMASYDPFFVNQNRQVLDYDYDFVVATEVVEHCYHPKDVFDCLSKLVFKRKGYIGIMTQILMDERRFSNWWYHNDPTHSAFYQPSTFRWIADKWNLTIIYQTQNVLILKQK